MRGEGDTVATRITARSQQLRRKNEDGVGRNGEPDALGIASATARHARTVAANSAGVDMNRVTGLRRMIRSQALSVYRWSPGIVTSGPLARDAVSLTISLPSRANMRSASTGLCTCRSPPAA